MNLLLASGNLHKIQEIKAHLGKKFSLSGLLDHGIYEDIVENGASFHENAAIKAKYVYQKTGLDVFSDDSGLEIQALGGAPGIYSARYSGTRDMSQNMAKVLLEMSQKKERQAQFITVICLILKGETYFFEGTISGNILLSPKGSDGFGYDPIFQPHGYEKSFAQISLKEKNKISHRAKALDKLKDFLKS